MLSYTYLFDYFVNSDNLKFPIYEHFLYDKIRADFVYCGDNTNWLEKIKNRVFTDLGRYIDIPEVSYCQLHIDFIDELNNQRLIDYMNLFGGENIYDGACNVIFCQEEKIYASEVDGRIGDIRYFMYEKIRPVVETWSKKTILK